MSTDTAEICLSNIDAKNPQRQNMGRDNYARSFDEKKERLKVSISVYTTFTQECPHFSASSYLVLCQCFCLQKYEYLPFIRKLL